MDNFNVKIHKLFLWKLKKLRKKINEKIEKNSLLRYIILFSCFIIIYVSLFWSIQWWIILGIIFLILFTDSLGYLAIIIIFLRKWILDHTIKIKRLLIIEWYYYYRKYIYYKWYIIINSFNEIYKSLLIILVFILFVWSISEYYIIEIFKPKEFIINIITWNITINNYIQTWGYLALAILIVKHFSAIIWFFIDKIVSLTSLSCIIWLFYFYNYTWTEFSKSLWIVTWGFFILLLIVFLNKRTYTTITLDTFKYLDLYYQESKWIKKEFLKMSNRYFENKILNWNIIPISDNPINYKRDDIFWYKDVADNTYNLIKWIDVSLWSYSIWIIWEWWLWKSSIIWMLKESRLKLDSKILIHDFNPWNYTKNDLVNKFITEIASKINRKDLTKLFIEYIETLSWINSTTSTIFKLIKTFFWNEKTIEEIRNQISDELKKLNKKLVIIIDDLDRCEPDEIITMLNVIKNIGNFNNVIYLISFDKLHIIEALKEKWFHEDYIEKIINTEIHIPIPSKEKKIIYFKDEFIKICEHVNLEKWKIKEACRLITGNWMTGLDEIFEKENLRFIKRLLNKLNVSLTLVFNTNPEKINELDVNNIVNIVLINYLKIKDIIFFNDTITKRQLKDGLAFKEPNRPKLYLWLQERRLHDKFMREIIWLYIVNSISNDDKWFRIWNFLWWWDLQKINSLNKNWKLLSDFS